MMNNALAPAARQRNSIRFIVRMLFRLTNNIGPVWLYKLGSLQHAYAGRHHQHRAVLVAGAYREIPPSTDRNCSDQMRPFF